MKKLALDNKSSTSSLVEVLDKNQKDAVQEAVRVLKRGEVIAYATETAYGLGADFFNPKAVNKIYKIKGRSYKKPLPIIVSSMSMAERIVKFNQKSKQLAKKYWPGALTLVLETRNNSKTKNLKFKTIALRISSNKLATAIVKKLGRPMTATSANVSGAGECYSANEVIKQFLNKKNQPALIINAGRLSVKKPSTVVRVVDDEVKVLRKGEILPSLSS